MTDDQDTYEDFEQLDTGVIEQLLEEYGIENIDELEDADIRELMERKEELVLDRIFDEETDNG